MENTSKEVTMLDLFQRIIEWKGEISNQMKQSVLEVQEGLKLQISQENNTIMKEVRESVKQVKSLLLITLVTLIIHIAIVIFQSL